MKQYHQLLSSILREGSSREDRTGVGTLSIFGPQMRFDLTKGFPLVTTKKMAWKSIVSELLWFLEGSSDERRLAEILYNKPRDQIKDKTTIWTANANQQGKDLGYSNNDFQKELGPIYGVQWRFWLDPNKSDIVNDEVICGTQDQIATLVNSIKTDPYSRRHILSAWNVADLDRMALPPCHIMSQFYVNNGRLSCMLIQRSGDAFLGVPFNIASYALLTHLIAHICGLGVGELIHNIGDAHIYTNHIPQVTEQLRRKSFSLPKIWINPEILDINKFTMSDIKLLDYQSHPKIEAEMAI